MKVKKISTLLLASAIMAGTLTQPLMAEENTAEVVTEEQTTIHSLQTFLIRKFLMQNSILIM